MKKMYNDIIGNDAKGSTFGLSIVYAVLFVPLSYLCWFRPAYKVNFNILVEDYLNFASTRTYFWFSGVSHFLCFKNFLPARKCLSLFDTIPAEIF